MTQPDAAPAVPEQEPGKPPGRRGDWGNVFFEIVPDDEPSDDEEEQPDAVRPVR